MPDLTTLNLTDKPSQTVDDTPSKPPLLLRMGLILLFAFIKIVIYHAMR